MDGAKRGKNCPRVSIGLPVYNGEEYLKYALDSILSQTYEDFELIVSDNGSTDRTEKICRDYASKDKRIRYYRNDKNLGAAWNFNHVFELSSGEYFKWATHDDLYAPDFLRKCIELLDKDPSVVLCHTKTTWIDPQGKSCNKYEVTPPTDSPKPAQRFGYLICVNYPCFPLFGLMRAESARATRLFGNYMHADRIFLARLALLGRFYEISEYLFFSRVHPGQSTMYSAHPHLYYIWWDPRNKTRRFIFPEWRLFWEYSKCAWSGPLSARERVACCLNVGRWLRRHWNSMLRDLVKAAIRARFTADSLTNRTTAARSH
jgi:glycosyltransferase involved in cell wall biosynthesis